MKYTVSQEINCNIKMIQFLYKGNLVGSYLKEPTGKIGWLLDVSKGTIDKSECFEWMFFNKLIL